MAPQALIWCTIITFITGLRAEATPWEQAMAAGKLPEMTLDQQMQMFGARIAVTAPQPTTPEEELPETTTTSVHWLSSIEQGSLPPMTQHQKILLFGSANVVQEEPQIDYYDEYQKDGIYSDQSSRRSVRSVKDVLDKNDTMEFLQDAFGAVTTIEGKVL